MRLILKLVIQIYWLIPSKYKRKCLFKESCSRHIYRINNESGFINGIKAFKERVQRCKPGYIIYAIENTEWIILVDGTVIEREKMSV